MSLPVLKFNVGDTKTLRFQLRAADKVTPVDITGLIFKFFARDKAGDSAYTINPVTGTIADAANGQFKFDVTFPSEPLNSSLYWITREDGGGGIDTFAPAEGTEIRILDK